ncbi:MAG: ABC transporter ATP-binding protein [Candidatus Korarchaeota archaeon]|nr:ABC transporter ATP-binding protein [Candidatus Korarchaeota archaeon]
MSLKLGPGLHVLAGPNGSGKTTLLKILAGLSRPTRGMVSVLGRDPYMDPEVRIRISYVPERLYLPPGLTAGDAVEAFRDMPGWREDLFERLAGLLGVDFMDRRVGELSEGMRQKLSLALFLSREPGLVLADEPTANLDPPSRFKVVLELRRLASGGAAVVLATHSLYEAALAADSILVLADGVLVRTLDLGAPRRGAGVKARIRGEVPADIASEPWVQSLGGGLYLVEAPSMEDMLGRLWEIAGKGRLDAVDPLLPGVDEALGGEEPWA